MNKKNMTIFYGFPMYENDNFDEKELDFLIKYNYSDYNEELLSIKKLLKNVEPQKKLYKIFEEIKKRNFLGFSVLTNEDTDYIVTKTFKDKSKIKVSDKDYELLQILSNFYEEKCGFIEKCDSCGNCKDEEVPMKKLIVI